MPLVVTGCLGVQIRWEWRAAAKIQIEMPTRPASRPVLPSAASLVWVTASANGIRRCNYREGQGREDGLETEREGERGERN